MSGVCFNQAKQIHVTGKFWGFFNCSDHHGCAIDLKLEIKQLPGIIHITLLSAV